MVEVGDVGRPVRDGRHFVVLVADDDEDDRGFIRTAVLQANPRTTVRCVSDGRELLDHLRAEGEQVAAGQTESDAPPTTDLVLLDLNMPRMNGIEFLRELRGDPLLHATPVVVLTTSDEERDRLEAYGLHVAGYLL
ncbi:MAG TPA: response regulator, partial [Acidimicrobiales bacterium]|nr:response regulator [Acidimicrobiales bacterium]